MTDTSTREPTVAESASYDQLRRLLVGDERRRLDELERRLADKTALSEEFAALLPIILERARQQDADFNAHFRAPVDHNLRELVRDDPQGLADSLFPVMGPAIRKSISEALSGFIENINQTLEHSLSPKSIGWRIEAMRTGRPFSEILFKHTMRYRVEQVFLIHSETGLLIAHAADADVVAQDSDAVSAMLTAIQDFVRDSFGSGNETLDKVEIGDHTVWLVRGPRAMLAAVVRGIAPAELRNDLRELIEKVHRKYPAALQEYAGDPSTFEGIDGMLATSLQQESITKSGDEDTVPADARSSRWKLIIAGILLALVAGLAWLIYQNHVEERESEAVTALAERIDAAPGLVVVRHQRSDEGWRISGLRDPLAAKPETFIEDASHLPPEQIHFDFAPYHSLEPDFQLARFQEQLGAPDTVTLGVRDDVIVASGVASVEWVKRAESQSQLPRGISRLDVSQVTVDELAEARALADKLRGIQIRFGEAAALTPEGRTRLNDAAENLQRLATLDRKLDLGLRVTLIGRSDGTDSAENNLRIKLARSRTVRERLIAEGVPAHYLKAMAVKKHVPAETPDYSKRLVEIRVSMETP